VAREHALDPAHLGSNFQFQVRRTNAILGPPAKARKSCVRSDSTSSLLDAADEPAWEIRLVARPTGLGNDTNWDIPPKQN
jgi:hypothetical protein